MARVREMMHRVLPAAATALVVVGEGALSQSTVRPLPVELVLGAPTIAAFSEPSFSPDGHLLAYTVIDNRRRPAGRAEDFYRTGVPTSALGGDVWLSDVDTGEPRNLTGGKGSNWAPSWSPDGRRLAFLSDRQSNGSAGGARLWVWERSSGLLRGVGRFPLRDFRHRLEWTRDGRAVLVELYPAGMSPAAYARLMQGDSAPSALRPSGGTARVFSFDPASPDSVPNTDQIDLDFLRTQLALVDVDSATARTVVPDARILDYAFSPDREKLTYAVIGGFKGPGSGRLAADLVVQELGSGRTRVVVADVPLGLPNPRGLFGWSPEGERIAYRTSDPASHDELYVVAAEGGKPRRIAAAPTLDVEQTADRPLWDPAGRYVCFTRDGAVWRADADGRGARRLAVAPGRRIELIGTERGQIWSLDAGRSAIAFTLNLATKQVGQARLDLSSGRFTEVVEEAKRYGGYGNQPVVSPDGKSVVYVAEDAKHPPEFWVADAGREHRRRVSRITAELTGYELGTGEAIEWHGLDGDILHGALVYPAGYQRGKRYPLVVVVYGGGEISNNLNRFGFHIAPVENLQLLATRGYAVLLADSKLHTGTPMLDLLKTVMPGVDRAIALGVADPNRIGITGHSYGGYSTLALLIQSSRFRAAVMRGGMGDLFGGYGQLAPDGTNYGLTWAEAGQGRMGGSPWEFPERYLENSPSWYLDRIRTPLLIIHGADDDAVPSFLADQVFTGLRRLGKTVTYARYAGEGHWEGDWSHANQLDYLTRVLAWFDRYLAPSGPDRRR